jgi:hypothetical protein
MKHGWVKRVWEREKRRNNKNNIKIDHAEMDCEDASWIKLFLRIISNGGSFITDFGLRGSANRGLDNKFQHVYIYSRTWL